MHFRAKLIQAFVNTVLWKEGFWCPSLPASYVCSIWLSGYSGTHPFQVWGWNCSFCDGSLSGELI